MQGFWGVRVQGWHFDPSKSGFTPLPPPHPPGIRNLAKPTCTTCLTCLNLESPNLSSSHFFLFLETSMYMYL